MIVSIDFETRSLIDIKKSGARRYAEDPSTRILCMAWAIDDAPPEIWLPGQPFPLTDYMGVQFNAWNAQFEIAIWKHCRPSDWLPAPAHMWHDTMGDAAMCGFPLALDKCAKALGTTEKLDTGTRLITKLCKPKSDGTFREYKDFPEDFHALYNYCKGDVVAERDVYNALPAHVEGQEDKIQRLTWVSNDRGVPVDVSAVQVIQKRLDEHIETIDHAVQKLTNGHLDSARQKNKLLMHLEMNREASRIFQEARDFRVENGLKNPRLKVGDIDGIILDNLRGEETEKVLKDWDISDYDRKLLTYQRDLNHASVAKFKKILLQLCKDGTIKDNLQFHGAGTGRDAARGFQLQNLPRDTEDLPEQLLEWFFNHDAKVLDLVFSVLGAASTLIRPMIKAPHGKKLVVSDYGQVEARGVPWLCNEEDILQDFRDGIDPYKAQACKMYHTELEAVTKTQRQYGKLAVLACIAEGQRVLTDHGLVPIEKVCCCMKVWDGVEWVHHDGAIYKGEREVMTYDGLQATHDHIIYTDTGKKIGLREASRIGERIAQTGSDGTPIRYGGHNKPEHESGERVTKDFLQMSRVRYREVDKSVESTTRENRGVSEMQPTETNPRMATEEMPIRETTLPEPKRSAVSQLWRKGDRVPVRVSDDNGAVGNRKSRAESQFRNRPDKKRWSLRTRKPSSCDPKDPNIKQEGVKCPTIPRISSEIPRCKICGQHIKRTYVEDFHRRRNSGEILQTKLQTKRSVWDVLNAGRRHRFTVEGKLVSNCGYQGSHKALTKFAEGYGLTIERKEVVKVIKKFRDARPKLVASWSAFSATAIAAVNDAGTPYQVPNCQKAVFQMQGRHLTMTLPSGRKLWYPYAEIRDVTVRYEDGETGKMKSFISKSVTSMWVSSYTTKWERRGMSGGNFLQNWVQAVCRDLLMEALIRVEEAGYEVIGRIHDELICLCPDDARYTIEGLNKLMCVVPEWAEGFPLAADGYESQRYRK